MKKVLIAGLFAVSAIASAQTGAEREMQKAINQVGEPCHRVTQIFHSGNASGSMMFSVACSGGQTYMVKANRDGTGNVVSCKVMEKIGLRCFVKLS
jgi:hypothetical protein